MRGCFALVTLGTLFENSRRDSIIPGLERFDGLSSVS